MTIHEKTRPISEKVVLWFYGYYAIIAPFLYKGIFREGKTMEKRFGSRPAFLMAASLALTASLLLGGCSAEQDASSINSTPSNESGATVDSSQSGNVSYEDASSEEGSKDSSSNTSSVAEKKIKWDKVHTEAVNSLKTTLPQITYKDSLSGGHTTEILLDKGLSEKELADEIHDSILNLLEYDLYLEYNVKPEQARPVVIDHIYSLTCDGTVKNDDQYVCKVRLVMNEQKYSDENFNSDEVIEKATDAVLNSANPKLADMSIITGSSYGETRMIEGVKIFEYTDSAAESLARYTENTILSVLYSGKDYTQFKLEYYAKGVTSYTFILYLK